VHATTATHPPTTGRTTIMSDILVVRIKFPEDYPIIYKSMKLRGELTVPEAIEYISTELSVPGGEQYGIYIPDQNFWLDNNTPLNEYRDRLANVVSSRSVIFFFCSV
jgi:hypothetical protein